MLRLWPPYLTSLEKFLKSKNHSLNYKIKSLEDYLWREQTKTSSQYDNQETIKKASNSSDECQK